MFAGPRALAMSLARAKEERYGRENQATFVFAAEYTNWRVVFTPMVEFAPSSVPFVARTMYWCVCRSEPCPSTRNEGVSVVPMIAQGHGWKRFGELYTRYALERGTGSHTSRTSGPANETLRCAGACNGHAVWNDHGVGTGPGTSGRPWRSLPDTLTEYCVHGANGIAWVRVRTVFSGGFHTLVRGTAGLICASTVRSEEHTSELQSQSNLVCRLLLEKKKNTTPQHW